MVEAHEAQKMVYVIGMAIGGLIEAMGMQAENQVRMDRGEVLAYDEKTFKKLLVDRGLHHNALITEIYGR